MARVLVLGAGMAGLVGARVLEQRGHEVVVLDKGRRPGGRMATRRPEGPGGPVFDHGAQFVTLRVEELAEETTRWRDAGWLVEWFRGSPDAGAPPSSDGHPRFRGTPYQRGLPEALAAELADVRCGVRVSRIVHDHGWVVTTDDGHALRFDALLSTPPAPQALTLLDNGRVTLPTDLAEELRSVTYEPCIALLAVPHGAVTFPPSGVVRLPENPTLDIVADNQTKGISDVPAVTIHASGDWSRDNWEAPDDAVIDALLTAAEPVMGTTADVLHVQRWRYSAPTSRHEDVAPGGTTPSPIRFAGDAFAGGRVEGAALSGWTAAHRLVAVLA